MNATEDSLRRVFMEGFTASDLAEPLASFDDTTSLETAQRFMLNRPLRIVGVRTNGIVTGYLKQDDLLDCPIAEQTLALDTVRVLNATASFQEIVVELAKNPFLLVASMTQPVGVIARPDLEKAPMRMWLFGMVTLIEMRLTRTVREFYPDGTWAEYVSETRFRKARELQQERSRRNQSVDLIDCLQLGDKGQLFGRSPELRQRWGRSRRQVEKVVKQLERLRNNLAHSQGIIEENWEAIVLLAETMDRVLTVPEHLSVENSLTPFESERRT